MGQATTLAIAHPLGQQALDVGDDLGDAALFVEDAGGERLGREVFDVLAGARVLDVEVAAVVADGLDGDTPGAVVFLAVGPPGEAVGELLETQWVGLGVLFAAIGQGLLVVPDLAGGAGAVEEEDVGRDCSVGGEDAVGQADDGMQIEFGEQVFFNAGGDAIAEERAVGDDDGGASGLVLTDGTAQAAHDELEEEQSRLAGAAVGGEVVLDAWLLLAAEGRIGEDDVYAVAVADLAEAEAKRVAGVNPGRFQAVEQQVHLGEQVGHGLGFDARDAALLEDALLLDGLHL